MEISQLRSVLSNLNGKFLNEIFYLKILLFSNSLVQQYVSPTSLLDRKWIRYLSNPFHWNSGSAWSLTQFVTYRSNSSFVYFSKSISKFNQHRESCPEVLPNRWSISHFCSIAAGLLCIRQCLRQQTVALKIELGAHFNLLKYRPTNKEAHYSRISFKKTKNLNSFVQSLYVTRSLTKFLL